MSPHKRLNVGIVRFPGSNCDFDTLKYFQNFGHDPFFIWYKDITFPISLDLLVLPGGFAFGDRVYEHATSTDYHIDPGEMAIKSPVMKTVYAAAKKQIPIVGICNGFQILTKARLLPGELVQNECKQFVCERYVACKFVGRSFFLDRYLLNKTTSLSVAHGYGQYVVRSPRKLEKMIANHQVFLEYQTDSNPNGSMHNIAGVCNEQGTIFGMMPHPERSLGGCLFIHAIEKYIHGF